MKIMFNLQRKIQNNDKYLLNLAMDCLDKYVKLIAYSWADKANL